MIIGQQCRCDSCTNIGRLQYPSLTDSLSALRKLGWRVTKATSGWRHYCPECVAKWKKPMVDPRPAAPTPTGQFWWQDKD